MESGNNVDFRMTGTGVGTNHGEGQQESIG